MKKLISSLLSIIIILSSSVAFADSSYINITPLPYSSHVLGEDLIIKGETDFSHVTIGLFYPEDQGYNGMAKYVLTIPSKELSDGFIIQTETYSRLWPRGIWTVKVQNGNVSSSVKINMVSEALYDRTVKLATYENNTLTNIESYAVRGISIRDNIIEFITNDGKLIKIYSWNNLAPVTEGESQIFVATYENDYLINIKAYSGTLSSYDSFVSLNSENKTFKLFYWNDNLTPIE